MLKDFAMRGSRGPGPGADAPDLMLDINTTPLIDVLLVLLVMLIITIPVQLTSVNLELPAGPPPADQVEPLYVKLEISPADQVRWDGELLPDRAALDARLRAAAALALQPEIHIRADRATRYESVAAVLSAAQGLGLQKVGLVGLEELSR